MNNVRFIPNVPYFRIWANIFDYKNRTKRKDFFIDLILSIVVLSILFYLCFKVTPWLLFAFFIHLIFPLIPLMVRRIRDTGNTPLWCLLLLIGGLGILPLFIMCFLKSNESEEKKNVTKGGAVSLVVGFISQIVLIPLFTIVILLVGLLTSEDYTNEFDAKFKPLENRDSYVYECDYTFYYQDYELNLKDFEYEGHIEEYILNDDIYFISESYDDDNYDVYIYKVSLDGEHFELIKSLEYNDTYSILYYTHDNIFYIQVRDNYSTLSLNAYDITNNSYYNIGYNFTYSSYSSTFNDAPQIYSVYEGDVCFVVTRLSDLEQKVIDEDILNNNEAGKLMIEYDYIVYSYIIEDDNIYLKYCLNSDSFMGVNYYLLFEYDYEKEELTFISALGTKIIDDIYKI